jgi:2'-5' RNA ligase
MQNYIVIFAIPKKVEKNIRSAYETTFNKSVPISNLHLTLLPPFSFVKKEGLVLLKESLKKLKDIAITASLYSPNLFRNPGETILYLPVNPEKEITKVHDKLELLLKDIIKLETSLYHTDEVPPFLAHISLDYNFTFNSKTLNTLEINLEKMNFKLTKPILMTQNTLGKWKVVN